VNAGVVYGAEVLLEQARPPSGRKWALSSQRLTIGRDPSSDVLVDDPGMSRHHADLIRNGTSWSVVDTGSTNGTYVNGARVQEIALRPGDRIRTGETEFVLRQLGVDAADNQATRVRYDVESQVGNISNVAGDQNYYQESNLRYIASQRGRARTLTISGLLLLFVGQGVGIVVFLRIAGSDLDPGDPIPQEVLVGFGLCASLVLLGGALFIFGLIARSGAKQEARRRGVDW
jgi:pSer/pThr/pTyr-binding forkhead associated (FHA) protein